MIKLHKLVYDEYALIKQLIKGEADKQDKNILDYYCGDVSVTLVDRVNRYYLMQGIENEEERIDLISHQLDKYNMLYNRQFITHHISKDNVQPLRCEDVRIQYFKCEIEAIKSLEDWSLMKLAFAILTYAKHNQIVHGESDLLNDDDLFIDLAKIIASKIKLKEDVYFRLYELVNKGMLEIPISLSKTDEKIKINYLSDESDEVVHTLDNTDIFNLSGVFVQIFGEYKDPQQKCVLEIDFAEDYYEIHKSRNEGAKKHIERTGVKASPSAITACINCERAKAGQSMWVNIEFTDVEDSEYIDKLSKFMRTKFKRNHRKLNKNKNAKWTFTKEFMGCVDEVTGEILCA